MDPLSEKRLPRVLLINLPGESLRKAEEHCGLAALMAWLERAGVDVMVLDAYALRLNMTECQKKILEWLDGDAAAPSYIGISPFVTSYENFRALGEWLTGRKRHLKIFAGGHFASLNREYLLQHLAWLDAIIVGEGEIACEKYIRGERNAPGIYARGNEEKFRPGPRILDPDILPFQSRYLAPEDLRGQPFALATSRGCYGNCSFCSIASFYALSRPLLRQSCRSARNVAEEIRELVRRYNIKNLKIIDDNFFRAHDESFLAALTEEVKDLGIAFRLSARPNDITPERAELLKKMGATVVAIGVESANPASLELFNKGLCPQDSDRAIEILARAGIMCLANFIMFDPVIDLHGLRENCAFIEKHLDDCVFHRIDSHLWIRSTDPVADKLEKLGLCSRDGFPYLKSRFAFPVTGMIFKYFSDWCRSDMREYYANADILMAGVKNETAAARCRALLKRDLEVLQGLIDLGAGERLEKEADAFIKSYHKAIL